MKIYSNIAISECGYLFNPMNGDSFSTNPVATDIVQLLKEGKNEDEIKKFLYDKYDVEKSTLDRDIDEFMQELKDYYLLDNNG